MQDSIRIEIGKVLWIAKVTLCLFYETFRGLIFTRFHEWVSNKLWRKFMWKRLWKLLWLTRCWKDWVLNINELWQGVSSNHWDHDPPLLVMTHMVYVWVITRAVGNWVQGGCKGRGAIPLPYLWTSVNLVSFRGPYYPCRIATRPLPPPPGF